jgi:competence protein ComEC
MIAGAAAWLTAPMDPPAWLGPAVFVAGFAAALGLMAWPTARVDGPARRLAIVLAALSALAAAAGLGLAAGELRGVTVAQNPYVGGEEAVRVEGWVVANDADNGPRLRLLVRGIDGVAEPPRNVRVSVSETGLLTAGRAATCRAVLGPPAGPMAPGAYDFARRAYFERLGATGFAYGRCRQT